MVSFEAALQLAGDFGKYQKFIYFFCYVVACLAGFNNLTIVFLAATPEHWCKTPSLEHLNISREIKLNLTIPSQVKNGRLEYSQCLQYDRDFTNWTEEEVLESLTEYKRNVSTVECRSGWDYDDSIYQSTIVSEWDLVCDKKMWVATSKSVYLAGFIAGVLIFGFISDKFGRKKSYIVSVIFVIVLSFLVPFSPNLMAFLIYRFLIGAVSIGNYTVIYILMMELVGPSWRNFVAVMVNYIYMTVAFPVTGVAYLIRDWRHLALAFASPSVLLLMNLIILPESPRWLYTQNRNEEGDKILRKIATINGKELPENLKIEILEEEKGKFRDLIRYPRLRLRMMNLCIQWFTVTMVFYGLAYSSSDFGGNPYLNFILGYAVELPANFLCHFSQRFAGRKTVLITFNIIGGAALLGIVAVPSSYSGAYNIILVLSLIGRMCAIGVFIMIYLYTAELLPTVVRSVGMGTCSAFARIGGISAQYLMGLKDVSIFIPFVSMGGLAIIAAFLLMPLPETKGRKLPETIMEGETFGRNDPVERVDNKVMEKFTEIESTYM